MGAGAEAGGAGGAGAAALIAALAAQGTRFLFGIPGVHTLLPFDLLHAHPTIRPVVTRHEGGAGFAADGYARASGEPGVCLVVPGPGATNLATAALVAQSDRVPLVLITATVPARLAGRQAVHESDLAALYRPLVKAQVAADHAGEIAAAVARAFALARAEPPGPVQLLLPYDLFARPASPPMQDSGESAGDPPTASEGEGDEPPAADLERALTLLREARAPLIYAGHGVVRAGAGAALVALAEALGAPVLTSNKARGAIPEDHPLAAGIPSMAGASALARGADVCLALGTRFNEYTTLTWKLPLPRRLIRVDRDLAALDRNYPAEVAIAGDVAATLDWLLERLPARGDAAGGLRPAVAALRERRRAGLTEFMAGMADARAPFHSRFVARLLREALPPDALLTSDGSATESWLYEPGFAVTRPGTLLVPEIQQTMGYAVGAALGAALGTPGRPVVAVVGDGSLTMTLGELATLAAERAPLTVAVFNDGCYNALRVRQEAAHGERYVGTLLGDLDFAQVARGLGLRGERVVAADQLRARFAEAAAPREPLLLDIPIAPAPLSERYAAVVEAGE
ncbi:MAG TPA: thiamine pyrophosphate-binding protein [Thermomicrobiales bacterium]|nr:thiamine pyrophosphate-binding protein [Thermomicrobiales bacterium]